MSLEVRPFGVKCNIQCQYCYQNPQRDAGNVLHEYDLPKMMAGIERGGSGAFTLFGGEPLLMPERDLEELWAWGYERYGGNSVQTNGSLVNEQHIRMFRQYRVQVGISVDGPDALNDVRWAGTLDATREATARTHATVERLCREGMEPSLIVTLHRGNATGDKLPVMHTWFRQLQSIGVRYLRLHLLEVEHQAVREKYALSDEENLAAMLSFLRLERELTTLKIDVFDDMRSMLRGQDDSTTCVWNACDPYTTRAVQGLEGNGQRSNCGRTNKDGVDFVKADVEGFERYLSLYQTPQAVGGCQGCRFFLMCKGQCPGTAIDADWRNRTEHCGVWKGLFRHLEEEMLDAGEQPLSASPLRGQVEAMVVEEWLAGRFGSVRYALERAQAPATEAAAPPGSAPGAFGAHQDAAHGDSHGDRPHGDRAHGDSG